MTTDTAPAVLTFKYDFWASVSNRSLQSGWIADAFYNRPDEELMLIFKEKDKHKARLYLGVPSETFFALAQADSAGTFYNHNIKKKFDSEPVHPPTAMTCVPKDVAVTLRNTVADVHARLDADLNGLKPGNQGTLMDGFQGRGPKDSLSQAIAAMESIEDKENAWAAGTMKSVTHNWRAGQQPEYNSLNGRGREEYDRLRTVYGDTHDTAFRAAKEKHGLHVDLHGSLRDAFGEPIKPTDPRNDATWGLAHKWQEGQRDEYDALTEAQKVFYNSRRNERGWYHNEARDEAKRLYPDADLSGWIVELDVPEFDGWHMVLPFLGEFADLGEGVDCAMDQLGILEYDVRGVRKVG
jgi:hypothetical protein